MQTDYNGTSTFSDIITVFTPDDANTNGTGIIYSFVNDHVLNIGYYTNAPCYVSIRINSLSGSTVSVKNNLSIEKGYNIFNLDLAFRSGCYILSIINTAGFTYSRKIEIIN